MNPGTRWPLGITVFLLALMGLYVYLYRVADDPNSLVVEANYYEKGIHYDSTMAQQRENGALGWRIVPTVTPARDGRAELRVALTDSTGARLDGAAVRVVATHNLLAEHPDSAMLVQQGSGEYAATLSMPHAGLWELQFAVTRGRARFTDDEHIDIALPAPAAR